MSRVKPVSPEQASSAVKEIYDGIKKQMGGLPNIFQNMGNSSAVLKGFLGLSDAAAQTSLDPKLREQIALIVGQTNHCNYCLSAHTVLGGKAGLQSDEIMQARRAKSSDSKTQAILKFAQLVVEKRAQVTDQDVKELKAAGVNDAEVGEIVMLIVLNIFTNYFNLVTDTPIDFPKAPELIK